MTITTINRTRRNVSLWAKRAGWLILIWIGSVAALGAAAYVMRMLMRAIGMSN
jgi:hypothetical protein